MEATPYENKNVVDFYTKTVGLGLDQNEEWATQSLEENSSCLILGCGCGREAFALERLGVEVLAIDSSLPMIHRAENFARNLNSRVLFLHCDFRSFQASKKFDAVYISTGFTGHFMQCERVEVLRKVRDLLNPKGQVIYLPDVHPEPWKDEELHRLNNKGDTLRYRFGGKQLTEGAFFHYYQSWDEVEKEIQLAQLSIVSRKDEVLVLEA